MVSNEKNDKNFLEDFVFLTRTKLYFLVLFFFPWFSLSFKIKIIFYVKIVLKFYIYNPEIIPLRFRKAGRVWCGGAQETH